MQQSTIGILGLDQRGGQAGRRHSRVTMTTTIDITYLRNETSDGM